MATDRSFLGARIPRTGSSSIPCGACGKGVLSLKSGSIQEAETCESLEARTAEWGDADTGKGRAVGLLTCSGCNEVSAFVAQWWEGIGFDANGSESQVSSIHPVFIEPAPILMAIPHRCPVPVREELERSFRLAWDSPEGTLTHIRRALEALMDAKRVPRTRLSKGRKRLRMSLGARINIFEQRKSRAGKLLRATKWLGNEGAHGAPDQRAIVDAYAFVEHVLEEMYESSARELDSKAKRINKSKGSGRRRPTQP